MKLGEPVVCASACVCVRALRVPIISLAEMKLFIGGPLLTRTDNRPPLPPLIDVAGSGAHAMQLLFIRAVRA